MEVRKKCASDKISLKRSEKVNNVDWPYIDTQKGNKVDTLLGTQLVSQFPTQTHFCRYLWETKCTQISTKMCFVFVLETKNSCGHVQTNICFGKVPNFLEKFPTFCVVVIPSPLSSYGVATLFPLPKRRKCKNTWRRIT